MKSLQIVTFIIVVVTVVMTTCPEQLKCLGTSIFLMVIVIIFTLTLYQRKKSF